VSTLNQNSLLLETILKNVINANRDEPIFGKQWIDQYASGVVGGVAEGSRRKHYKCKYKHYPKT
jgi:hypothetical protein